MQFQQDLGAAEFAVCIRNDAYPVALELHRLYRVLPDADAARLDLLRVVDESGESYLYARDYFRAVPSAGTPPRETASLAICILDDGSEADLTEGAVYIVLPDPAADEVGWIRIIDDSGEDYLYPADCFAPVDVPARSGLICSGSADRTRSRPGAEDASG